MDDAPAVWSRSDERKLDKEIAPCARLNFPFADKRDATELG